jgi:hypothetical protein
MGIARFTARIYTYSAPWPEPVGPLTQEQGETLTLEWDRQSGVQEQTSLVTSFTWVLHKVFGDPSSPLVTWTLWDDRGTVTQDGYHFDFVAMVGDSQPIGLRGMLAVVLPPEPAFTALAAIREGEGMASLIAFGDLSGDLSGIPPL